VAAPAGAESYVLEPLDPAALASARATREGSPSQRVGLEVLLAEDGAREARQLVDRERGPCFSIAGAVGGGEDRCVPDAVAWATYAADAACKVPIAYQVRRSNACPRAAVVVAYGPEGCTVRTRFFDPGPDVKLEDVYVGSAPSCTKVSAQPALYKQLARDHVFYGVGGPLAEDALAPLGATTVGDGRLALYALADAAGTPLVPPRPDTLYDKALGAPCRVMPYADGAARCVPADALTLVTPAFADPSCTREVVGVPSSPSCPEAQLPTVGLRVATETCTTTVYATAAVRLGAPLPLNEYYTKDARGACSSQHASGVFLEVLGDLADDALAHVREAVE
jgi:hypothetical protein